MASPRLNPPGGTRATVGLEVHVRLRTRTKLFCGCLNATNAAENSLICPVCLGLPGSLPVLSEEAVTQGLSLAAALGCRIPAWSRFVRKHYFYPDLPRNFQITQHARPLAVGGLLPGTSPPGVAIQRVHLEEDAGRLLAGPDAATVAVDMNRAGAPLLEIVTGPELEGGEQARRALAELRRLIVHLGVGEGSMETGSLRCDANVGFGPQDPGRAHDPLPAWWGPWTELKNLNSLKAVQQAVDFEIGRLTRRLAEGRPLVHETRGWRAAEGRTFTLRLKEETRDYRFLEEPDLPPLVVGEGAGEAAARRLPELPSARRIRYVRELGLPPETAAALCRDPAPAAYFEEVSAALAGRVPGTAAALLAGKWVATEILALWPAAGLDPPPCPVSAAGLADLLALVAVGRLSGRAAKGILPRLAADPGASAADLMGRLGLQQVGDPAEIRAWCREVLDSGGELAAAYRRGKTGVLDHLVGRVLARSGGRAAPAAVRRELESLLAEPE